MTRLSICIATRNRAHVIGQTLDSFVDELPDSVEILVVDGASNDDTQRVISEYARRCRQLRYVRLEENGGVDLDYHRAVEHARGEFCWLMTDDDLIVKGGIRAVLDSLSDDLDLLIVNSRICNEDFSRVLQTRRLDVERDHCFGPAEFGEFFKLCAQYMSFIGCVVIRRSVWMARNKEPYLGTEFIHCGMIFQRRLERGVRIIAAPLIELRYGVAQWSARGFQIWMFKWPKLIWSFDLFSSEQKLAVVPLEPWRELRALLYYRALGQYSADVYQSLCSRNATPIGWRLKALAVARMPCKLCCNACAVGAAFLSPDKHMLQFELQGSPHYYPAMKIVTKVIAGMTARLVARQA